MKRQQQPLEGYQKIIPNVIYAATLPSFKSLESDEEQLTRVRAIRIFYQYTDGELLNDITTAARAATKEIRSKGQVQLETTVLGLDEITLEGLCRGEKETSRAIMKKFPKTFFTPGTRYIASTVGEMPAATLDRLRKELPRNQLLRAILNQLNQYYNCSRNIYAKASGISKIADDDEILASLKDSSKEHVITTNDLSERELINELQIIRAAFENRTNLHDETTTRREMAAIHVVQEYIREREDLLRGLRGYSSGEVND